MTFDPTFFKDYGSVIAAIIAATIAVIALGINIYVSLNLIKRKATLDFILKKFDVLMKERDTLDVLKGKDFKDLPAITNWKEKISTDETVRNHIFKAMTVGAESFERIKLVISAENYKKFVNAHIEIQASLNLRGQTKAAPLEGAEKLMSLNGTMLEIVDAEIRSCVDALGFRA
jgi:hypothetical protein